jgi:hypothetical protein
MAQEIKTEEELDAELRDLQSDMQLVMKDLLTGQEMRHSLDPAVSDFTNAASVAPDQVLSILTNWHNQGLVFSKIPNDDFYADGVQYKWKLNWTGYLSARDLSAPVPTLTSIAPATGTVDTTETVVATGTNFDAASYIAVEGANVQPTTFDSATQLTADVDLPSTAGDLAVTVVNNTWGTTTDPQTFTVT